MKKVRMDINKVRSRAEDPEERAKSMPTNKEEWKADRTRQLKLILSAHVGDLKGAARREIAEELLKHLEKSFGTCKAEWQDFMHTGVQHTRTKAGILCHQFKYVEQLRSIAVARGAVDEKEVEGQMKEQYHSLLGGVAWTVITRADILVYVQALQRRGAAPRNVDCRRLNLVVRYLKKHPTGLF